MSGSGPDTRADALRRRLLPLVTVVPYVLLAVLAGITVQQKWSSPASLIIDLALCAAAAGWLLWMITLHPAWRERPRVMAVFLAVLLTIMAVLVVRDPWFGCFAPAGYFLAFRLLPWPGRLAGIGGVAVLAGMAQASTVSRSTWEGLAVYAAVIAANALPMCGFAWIDQIREAHRRLDVALAENAGLHRQLLEQARAAGVNEERQRMAREIHDTLAQGLIGIITQLQAAEHAEHDPDGRRRHLAAAAGLARESLSEARRSVHELRPEPLETARLSEALAAVAERWSALHGTPVRVTTTGTVQVLQPPAELALLRVAQEALANVAKHAEASRVGLTLSYLDGEVALDVRDDGKGFDAGTVDAVGGGFGLLSMRQRIEGPAGLAGTLQIESEPGAGTAISARVPSGGSA
jgi:signal transduction histidine kinase